MTKPQNIAPIEKATHKSWEEWVRLLDDKNGRDLTHPEIVKLAYAELEGAIDKPGGGRKGWRWRMSSILVGVWLGSAAMERSR